MFVLSNVKTFALKEKNKQGCYNAFKLPDVCSKAMNHVSLSLTSRKFSVHLHALYSPRTALRTLHPAGINS
jgi:hypothetical protein